MAEPVLPVNIVDGAVGCLANWSVINAFHNGFIKGDGTIATIADLVPPATTPTYASGDPTNFPATLAGNVLTQSFAAAKLRQPRESTTQTTSPITPNVDICDVFTVTALANNLTINGHTGSPRTAQELLFRITSVGGPWTLTWNANYHDNGGSLLKPTATTANKTMYVWFLRNSNAARWDLVRLLDGL